MKILIDIDENDFLACKHWLNEGVSQWAESIIANGTPFDEEVQKSEWIKDTQGNTICSNCGFECLYSEDGFLYSLGRYCHHCGAKMQKGGAE